MQEFPENLLEPNYRSPKSRRSLHHSEVKRRGEYIQHVERALPNHPLLGIVRACLQDDPELRPTARDLLCTLEGMKTLTEFCHEDIVKTNAIMQVIAARDFIDLEQHLQVITL